MVLAGYAESELRQLLIHAVKRIDSVYARTRGPRRRGVC
jgi:hypothetical protein